MKNIFSIVILELLMAGSSAAWATTNPAVVTSYVSDVYSLTRNVDLLLQNLSKNDDRKTCLEIGELSNLGFSTYSIVSWGCFKDQDVIRLTGDVLNQTAAITGFCGHTFEY